MSTFIRRYGRYLNEKAFAYRQMAFDFTRVKKGYVEHGIQREVVLIGLFFLILLFSSSFKHLPFSNMTYLWVWPKAVFPLIVTCPIASGCSYPCGASNALSYSSSAEGVMRTMTTEKLLKGMPVLQTQIDTLLEFDVSHTLAWFLHLFYRAMQHRKTGFSSLSPLRFIQRSWTMGSSMLHFCFSSRTWSNCLHPTMTESSTY